MQWRVGENDGAGSGPLLAGVLLLLGATWIALYLVRIHAHQANVDDYLYAVVTRELVHSPDPITAVLHTGQNSPLVLLLAAPGVDLFGVYGGLLVNLPLLLLLGAGAFVLARRWLSPSGAALTALAVGLNTAVLGYSVMFNFAVASTAAVVWCFAAYLKSGRLSSMGWSIGFGVAFAALVLSRSISPVYAVPLLVVVVVDMVLGARRLDVLWRGSVLASAATILVIAGPWWAVSGPAVWHYLTYAGYQASSGYTSGAVRLTPAAIVDRVHQELSNLGWAESVALGLMVVAALWQTVWDRRVRQLGSLWIPAAWIVATLLILASSSNPGTAFGLPLIAVTIVVCAVVLGRTIDVGTRRAPVVATILVVALLAGAASQFSTSKNGWWPTTPYRVQALSAGATTRTNIDALTASVAHSLPPGIAIAAAEGPHLNGNGLQWYARAGTDIHVPTGEGSTRTAISQLRTARSLVTERGDAVFNPMLDQITLEEAASRAGYRATRIWKPSKSQEVVLWTKSSNNRAVFHRPVVYIRRPQDGATLKGRTYLFADANDVLGVAHVRFEVRGSTLARPLTIAAVPLLYGWIGGLNTDELAPGTYTVTCVAESVDGADGSRTITVDVHN